MNQILIEPMDQLTVDFYGPLKEDGRFIMVVTDLYSRYPFATSIKSVSGDNVIPELDKIFKQFGYPRLTRSDNGAPFNGKEWKEFTKKHDIIIELITPYHAQANGLVERFMKNLTTCRRIAHTYGKPYRQVIDEYLEDYRSTPHSSTGKTPVALIFNYSCNTSNLPYIRYKQTYWRDNQIAEHNDALAKEQMKQQKEVKGHFGYQNFKAGEEVRVKLSTKQSKNIPPNTIETFIIKDVLGTQIRSERTNPDGTITTCTRDDSFFKRTHTNANLSSESMDCVDLIIQPAEPINTSNQNTEHDVVEHEITEKTTTEPAPLEQTTTETIKRNQAPTKQTATKEATKHAQKQQRTEPTTSRQSPRPIFFQKNRVE